MQQVLWSATGGMECNRCTKEYIQKVYELIEYGATGAQRAQPTKCALSQ